jgi:hypothetical protein
MRRIGQEAEREESSVMDAKGAVDRWQAGLQGIAERHGPFPIPEIDGGREALARMSAAEIDQWLAKFELELIASQGEETVDRPEAAWDPSWGPAPRIYDSVDALVSDLPNFGKG